MKTITISLTSLFALFMLPIVAFAATPSNPLILVPTVLGSFPSEDGPVLDPVFHTYDNLIATFTANGYVLGSTLFPFPYNFEQSIAVTANELKDKIDDVLLSCGGCTKVDILGHGEGGVVAWQYIQGGTYGNDVDQFVFLGNPFLGIPAAYLAAEGGIFRLHATLVGRGLGQALLNAEASSAGQTAYDYVQASAPAFSQLLPTVNYLFSVPTSYPTGYPQNSFLENLQSNFGGLFSATNVINLSGDTSAANSTTEGFSTVSSTNPPLWPHGEPTSADLVFGGDRVVPRESIVDFYLPDEEFGFTDHRMLPTEAQSSIFASLTGVNPTTVVENNYSVSCILFLTTSPGSNLKVTDPNGDRLGKNIGGSGVLSEIANSFYSGYNADTEYAIVADPIDGNYQVQIEGSGTFTVNTSGACGEELTTAEVDGTVDPGDTSDFDLTVDADGEVITIEPASGNPPADTAPPPIPTHLSPANNSIFTTANFTTTDWTDVVDPSLPITYRFETSHSSEVDLDSAFISPVSQPGTTTVSQIGTAGTPEGIYFWHVRAIDGLGNASAWSFPWSFTIDNTPPVLSVPSSISQVAESAAGATAEYVATADDVISGPLTPNCTPLSGSVFSVGNTQVNCSATDQAGNIGIASFIVTILPASVQVHIFKYLNGEQATPENANNTEFPMLATWTAQNSGIEVPFTLGPLGWSTDDIPYEASTASMTSGASYSTREDTNSEFVSASCDTVHPYALVGYTTGDTLLAAATATISTLTPGFTGMTSDKYIIVWNKTCPVAPKIKVHIIKYLDGAGANAESSNNYQFP